MPPSNKPSIPRVYSAYDPPPRVRLDCSAEPVLTQQNFRDECDINNIIARFKDNGFADVPQADYKQSVFDVASAVDFHTAQNIVKNAEAVFSELPVAVRKRFHGSPLEFLSFVDQLDQPEVYSEAQALGLLKPMASNLAADAAAAAGPSGSPRAAAAAPAAASVDLKGGSKGGE